MYAVLSYFCLSFKLIYIYIRVCNSLIILNKHKSKMKSDLLGSLAGGYAMLGDVTNSNSG